MADETCPCGRQGCADPAPLCVLCPVFDRRPNHAESPCATCRTRLASLPVEVVETPPTYLMGSDDLDPRPIVAATLRLVADWGLQTTDDKAVRLELLSIADRVQHLERDHDCCPICAEVSCDEYCPLVGWRQW